MNKISISGHLSPFLESDRLTGTPAPAPEETILCEFCGKEIGLQDVQYSRRDAGRGDMVWLELCGKCFKSEEGK